MDDMILRRAAIDAVHKEFDECLVWDESGKYTADEVERILTTLPSAQPEQIARDIATIIENEKDMRVILNAPSAQSEIIRCKDCMHNGSFDTDCPIDWNGKEYCSFAERIQDADSSGNMSGTQKELEHTETHSCDYQRMVTHEPQRMRGKGRWNVYYHGEENGKSIFSYSCNQCGYGAPYNIIGGVCEQKKWNFCPNCGADMRGTE